MNIAKIKTALEAPFITNEAGYQRFAKLVKDAVSGDQKAQGILNKKLQERSSYITAAVRNESLPEHLQKEYEMRRMEHVAAAIEKNFASLSGTRIGTIGTYSAVVDDLDQDMNWMQFFRFTSSSGVGSVELIDFIGAMSWKEYNDGATIEPTDFGRDTKTELFSRRFGIKVPYLTRWLETNDMYTVNDMMQAMQERKLELQANQAYTELDAQATTFAAGIGPTIDNIVDTWNRDALALITANSLRGYTIAPGAPIRVLYRQDHVDTIMQVMERNTAPLGTGDVDRSRPRYNFIPVPTTNSNFPTQLTASGATDSVLFALRPRKTVWNNFRAQETRQQDNFDTHSREFTSQEYWNYNVDSTEVRAVGIV